jgi:pimeloyl-ACP methyl ester carboxylesterase
MEIRHHTVRANGIRQHYLDAGQGPPVVLLHGFPETNYAWRHQIPALATRYRVIAPDLRGYGETDKPASGYDKRTMALDLVELLKTLEIGKIALAANSRPADVTVLLFVGEDTDYSARWLRETVIPDKGSVRHLRDTARRDDWIDDERFEE